MFATRSFLRSIIPKHRTFLSRVFFSSSVKYLSTFSGSAMRAIRIHKTGGPEVLTLDEKVDCPSPNDKEILVAVAAAGVNYIDTYHRTGLYTLPLPAIIGREGSGVVEAVGKDVKGFKAGDRVAFLSQGAYAEKTVMPADSAVVIPEDMSLNEAAAIMLQGLTAHYLVTSTYPVKKGDYVLIHAGAGGTGGLLIQMAKLRGGIVITTVSSSEKAEIAKTAGADHIINYTTQNFQEEVKKITGGKGCEVVYDGVGKSTWEQSMKSLKKRGYLVLFGNASGAVPPINPLVLLQNGSLFLTRPTLYDYIAEKDEFTGRCKELFGWFKDRQVTVRIAAEFELSKAAEAHKFLEARLALGKVLLIVNSKL